METCASLACKSRFALFVPERLGCRTRRLEHIQNTVRRARSRGDCARFALRQAQRSKGAKARKWRLALVWRASRVLRCLCQNGLVAAPADLSTYRTRYGEHGHEATARDSHYDRLSARKARKRENGDLR